MNIVVLAGGISTEREVSIVSGTKVCEALRSKGHKAILLDVFFGNSSLQPETAFASTYNVEEAADFIHSFDGQVEESKAQMNQFFGPMVLELCKASDIVFLALHGESGENGKLQATFDLLNIPYTGSGSLGSGMAMDKGISKQLFAGNGIPSPKGVVIVKNADRKTAVEYDLPFPCVVKPCCGGSSVGVYMVDDEGAFQKALEEAFALEEEVVAEECIKGREFSVGVVDGEAYPIIEIAPIEGFYDYKNKYVAGSSIETCPADLRPEATAQMQKLAVEAYHALKLEKYARIDFLMNEQGDMFCLEANTLPGMTPTSLLPQEAAALGMDFAQLCEKLIQVSMK